MKDTFVAWSMEARVPLRCPTCRRWFALRALRTEGHLPWWKPAPEPTRYRCRRCTVEVGAAKARDRRNLY